MADTYPVRVVIREITYASRGTNLLDQPVITYNNAYGPGRPEIEPMARLGADADPESQEYADAMMDFRLGQRVELMADDYVRLRNGGAVVDAKVAERAAEEAEGTELDVRSASVTDLADWISEDEPNVNATVGASEGDPDLAKKLLEAEAEAAQRDNREVRKGVVDGLSAVVARG